jgi:hypothetical protein
MHSHSGQWRGDRQCFARLAACGNRPEPPRRAHRPLQVRCVLLPPGGVLTGRVRVLLQSVRARERGLHFRVTGTPGCLTIGLASQRAGSITDQPPIISRPAPKTRETGSPPALSRSKPSFARPGLCHGALRVGRRRALAVAGQRGAAIGARSFRRRIGSPQFKPPPDLQAITKNLAIARPPIR